MLPDYKLIIMIKLENILGNKKIVVGEKGYDLVLQSLGKIYIKQGNSLKNLEDLFKDIENVGLNDQTLYFIDSLDELDKVPDNKLVYSNKSLYVKIDGKLEELINSSSVINGDYVQKSGDIMTGTLEIDTNDVPLKVKSSKLIKNLNADYLRGKTPEDFAQKTKDENISGKWSFSNLISFFKDVFFKGSLVSASGFASGFSGYGWKLDSETNTLTIDNLVVRKIMAVYELVVNKISATNGSLWISSGAKITEVISLDGEVCDETWYLDVNANGPFIQIIEKDQIVNRHLYNDYFEGAFYQIKLDDTNVKHSPFRLFDILRCQRFSSTNIKYYDCIVTKIDNSYIYVRLSHINNNVYSDGGILLNRHTVSVDLDSPESGDSLVRIGNILRPERQGSIYLSSEEENCPYIDILQGVNRPDFSVLLQDAADNKFKKFLKVRLGNLNGIYDPAFGSKQPKGYGLYGENIFIKGVFVQVDPDGSETPMTIFRGPWLSTVSYYRNNQVSYEGQIYTCKVDGPIMSTFSPDKEPEYWLLTVSKGQSASELRIHYSANITGPWSDTFEVGHIYAETSTDGGNTWSKPFKIVGEDGTNGEYVNYQFCVGTYNSPNNLWQDAPPTQTALHPYVWMRKRRERNGIALEEWSVPTRLTGKDAYNLLMKFSPDGIKDWTVHFKVGDCFAMSSTDGGANWTLPYRIVGEEGQEGIYMNFKFKMCPIETSFNPWNSETLDETWLDSPQVITDKTMANFMTCRYYLGKNPAPNSEWSYPSRITGIDGNDGVDGADGPSILFFGQYSLNYEYFISSTTRIVVYIFAEGTGKKEYYMTKIPKEGAPEGNFKNVHPTNPIYWKTFSGNFKSVATEILFAEFANIGGLIFKNEQLISQSGKIDGVNSTDIRNPKFVPNLIIDGKVGLVDMIKGSFGKQLDGSGFFVEGNNIIGKTLNNNLLSDRIHITTDALPKLSELLAQEGESSQELNINLTLAPDIDNSPFTPQGIDTYNNMFEQKVLTCQDAIGMPGKSNNSTIYSYTFKVNDSLNGVSKRFVKFNVDGLGYVNCNYGKFLGSCTNKLYLMRMDAGHTSELVIDKSGTHILDVVPGGTYKFKLTCNYNYVSNLYYEKGDLEKDHNYPIGDLGDLRNGHKVQVYPRWPILRVPVDSSKNYFMAQYLNTTLKFPTINLSNVFTFEGVSKTIIANDGFCSYWGPSNYFYFQKDVGLSTPKNTPLNQYAMISEAEAANLPKGTVYYTLDGTVKIKL